MCLLPKLVLDVSIYMQQMTFSDAFFVAGEVTTVNMECGIVSNSVSLYLYA